MPKSYAAFISYAHRYQEWVGLLQRNLEACLRAAGRKPAEIFLDQTDLASGRSWVEQLQKGISDAGHLILVATPEALASPRVAMEWDSFIAQRPDWAKGYFHVVMLVDVPLPPFPDAIQWLSFVDHDEIAYRRELAKLAGALLGRGSREKVELPADLDIPASPADVLPANVRRRLVAWLAQQVQRKLARPAVVTALGVPLSVLDGHPTPEGAASAALVASTGDDQRVQAARRIVRALREAFEEEDASLLAELDRLTDELGRLGDGPGEGGLLGAWLARVARDHSKLVPFFEHADLELLDRVYVQLELRPEARLLRGQDEAGLELARGQLTLRKLLDFDRAQHLWITHRWVVLGDPGAGKTTLLRHLAARLATDPARSWVPVFESLPRLMQEPEFLLARLERNLSRAGAQVKGLAAVLEHEAQEGRLLLLFDGLDEVPRERRDEAEAVLRDVSARWPKTPLVVTSRPIGYRRPDSEFVELELLPFGEDQRREFLTNWFGRPTAPVNHPGVDAVMNALRCEPGLWDLSGNPLYLTLMALLFEEGKTPDRNRARLYEDVFNLLLDGRHRPGGQPIDAKKHVYELLRRLACDMTADNRDTEPRSDLEARLLHEDYDKLCAPLRHVPAWERSLGPFLDDLAEKAGILGPHDGPAADWRYWHRTFREALTAEHLAAEMAAGGAEKVLERAQAVAGDESRWAEPFALLVGRVEDPDTLVTSLVETNRALGLRAVATAQRLSDATLRKVLQLTDEPEERSKVYEEIPTLLDDPERAVALVDQLRQRTRNGNDLFFLDLALAGIAEHWPEDAGRLVESARGRFFDHIPPPGDAELLWKLDSPLDGRVNLWREIQEGKGWVGSPEDEEGDVDREGPRRRVEIVRPFWLGAGPVTNAQYAAFDPSKPFHPWNDVSEAELPAHPRVNVTWYEAVSFCRWLGTLPGFAGTSPRLPMEEEWEYACRAGTSTRFWSGNEEADLAEVGWFAGNSPTHTRPVGSKPANKWGLYDVHGNVWEWTASSWDGKRYQGRSPDTPYPVDPAALPADLAASPRVWRVMRGGCFWNTAQWCRSAYRNIWDLWNEFWYQGFRVLLSSAPGRGQLRVEVPGISPLTAAPDDPIAQPARPRSQRTNPSSSCAQLSPNASGTASAR